MTSADDFVIQFIQDKALVSPDDVAAARAALGDLKAVSYTHLTLPTNREV